MLLWLFFALLVAPLLFPYLLGDLIYGVGKVYAGDDQPTRDSRWMSKKSWSQVGIVFLYAYTVIGICIGATYCIGYKFEVVKEISRFWDDWNPHYHQGYTRSQMILRMILNTLGFMLIIPFAGILLVAFMAVLFEHDAWSKRLYNLCKENFCFLYTKILGYIFCVVLLLVLTIPMNFTFNHADPLLPDSVVIAYWWNFILMLPAITTILPIVLYMSIRVRNEELTQEIFADEIGLSRSGDRTSPLIPQGDGGTEVTDTNEVGMTPNHDDASQ
ncbi:predicted protein [Chaetoceros tenuissimus]|uniref:Uncharacterized protein n=1 Tax=Chaetoceros tenuissimus TaxID=426638 RepID=A0AAD3D0U2_9STRA|nr:predicted protein [Chaetoceros tenuissimus]